MSRFLFATVLIVTSAVGCFDSGSQPRLEKAVAVERSVDSSPAATAASHTPERIATEHLPNAVRVHDKVISGGQPEGDAAFEELRELGVKTILSVDGARPDAKTAARFGLRYVHLPHGYDGIPNVRVKELAKAVRDLEGPIYIHCHHGKHRSPAAASVACVGAGLIPSSEARSVLTLAGTSRNYRGLYQSAEEARPLEAALLDELEVEFRETVEIPPLAEAMVALEHTHDRLNAIAKDGWRTPPDHPDLEPAHEALLLREQFTELLRVEYVRAQPGEFQAILRDSESAAQELEEGLRDWMPSMSQVAQPESLSRVADRIATNCKACHATYRDVPLGEKR